MPQKRRQTQNYLGLIFLFFASFLSTRFSYADDYYVTRYSIPPSFPCTKEGICLPSEVGRVEIVEGSTSEILASCEFKDSNYIVAAAPAGGSWFDCERTFDAASKNTTVTLNSKQANLPLLHVYYLVNNPEGSAHGGIWDEMIARASDGVVRTPKGEALEDPYADPQLPFAGVKEFYLYAENEGFKEGTAAVEALKAAGYDALLRRFDNGVSELNIHGTFDGRSKMYQDVLAEEGWVPSPEHGQSHGNKGILGHPRVTFGTPFGITILSEHYFKDEKPITGFIVVANSEGEFITDAEVRLNGLRLDYTEDPVPGYDVSNAPIKAGKTHTIEIKPPNWIKPLTLTFECPPAIAITSPEEGSIIKKGPVQVQWSAPLPSDRNTGSGQAPDIGQFACRDESGAFSRLGHGSWFKPLQKGQTQMTITDLSDSCAKSYIELRIAGPLSRDKKGNYAGCRLIRRVMQVE